MNNMTAEEIRIRQLERELRITKNSFEKLTAQYRAKEAMETAMAAQTALQKSYTNMLLESSPSPIVLLDAQGRFRLCTQSLLDALNIPNFDYISGRDFLSVIDGILSENDKAFLAERFQSVMHGDLDEDHYAHYFDFSGKGDPRYYTVDSKRIGTTEGSIAGFLAVFTDNTELEEQKLAAERANHSKSDFLAAMSHEIRTPMNAIIGLNDILARTELDEKQRKYLADIRNSAGTLLGLINDILDFSKIEAGKMTIVSAVYNLRGLLEHLNSMYGRIFADKDLYFHMEIDDNLPEWVTGDEMRVRQTLTNLITNAAKYTRTGGGVMKAHLDETKHFLIFEMHDTGIGVKEDEVEQLFKPFERLDIVKNRAIQGAGLGLPISANFCKLMGGSLSVVSEYGKGSCFIAKLPYVYADKAHFEEEESADVFPAPELKVLVVDDIEINLDVAAVMLEAFGIRADLAGSGEAAIKKVCEKDYDVVFMDHMMPEMDGIETTQCIRAMGGKYKDLPIIALTANAVNDAEKNFLENGFTGFLAKPLELSTLSRCLKKLVKQ
jgi:signal transduction histidine kinase/ActR/RegA family two-component response regulator